MMTAGKLRRRMRAAQRTYTQQAQAQSRALNDARYQSNVAAYCAAQRAELIRTLTERNTSCPSVSGS